MNNIPKERKKEILLYRLSYLILFAVFLALHHFTKPGFSDDSWFASKLNEYTLPGYLIWRYTHWTSRLILESFLVVLAHGHFLIWCVLDTGIVILLIASVQELLGMDRKAENVFLTALLLGFVPMGILYSAGWIATSTNYFWPAAFAAYGMIPLGRFLRGEKVQNYEYFTFTAAVILAADQEQAAAILCAFYIMTLVFGKKISGDCSETDGQNKSGRWFLLVLTGILILSLLFIATCPGNAFRNAEEIRKWFPEYPRYPVLQRVWMGFLSTMSYYASGTGNQLLLPVFTGLLAWCVWSRKNSVKSRIFSLIPFVCVTLTGFPVRYPVREGMIWHPSYYYDLIANIYIPGYPQCNYVFWQVILESICFLGLLVWMGILLWFVSDTRQEYAAMLAALTAGFGSRWMVGLSPTVYASGFRTTLFGTLILQTVGLHLVQKISGQSSGKKWCRILYILLIILLIVTVWFESDGKTY